MEKVTDEEISCNSVTLQKNFDVDCILKNFSAKTCHVGAWCTTFVDDRISCYGRFRNCCREFFMFHNPFSSYRYLMSTTKLCNEYEYRITKLFQITAAQLELEGITYV